MLNIGVIASAGQKNNLPKAGGQTYTGSSNYIPPVFAPGSPQAPVVSGLTVGEQFVVGNVATWDVLANPPSTIYNVVVYNADKTVDYTVQQSLNGNISGGFAGLVSVPTGGTVVVTAANDFTNNTLYSIPTEPLTLQQLGVTRGGHA
jgi:hypothetical protein